MVFTILKLIMPNRPIPIKYSNYVDEYNPSQENDTSYPTNNCRKNNSPKYTVTVVNSNNEEYNNDEKYNKCKICSDRDIIIIMIIMFMLYICMMSVYSICTNVYL